MGEGVGTGTGVSLESAENRLTRCEAVESVPDRSHLRQLRLNSFKRPLVVQPATPLSWCDRDFPGNQSAGRVWDPSRRLDGKKTSFWPPCHRCHSLHSNYMLNRGYAYTTRISG